MRVRERWYKSSCQVTVGFYWANEVVLLIFTGQIAIIYLPFFGLGVSLYLIHIVDTTKRIDY